MKRTLIALLLIMPAAFAADPPPWAFPVGPAYTPPPPDPGTILHVPGSEAGFTATQLRNVQSVPDWHPESHPPMPDVVARGRAPKLWACGYCHLPTGQGRPENASLAGLTAGYIKQQVLDMKAGTRISSQPKMEPPMRMHEAAVAVTEEEIDIAAAYFAGLTYKPWIKVVEATLVPKTRTTAMLIPLASGEKEPIGQRIIEVPVEPERTEMRDFATGFIAYVPIGAVKRGERIVKRGIGGGAPCATCHGEDYRGLGPVPSLAGRSPSYIVRQLYDMRSGARAGTWSALMARTITDMTDPDMLAVAAYLAAQKP